MVRFAHCLVYEAGNILLENSQLKKVRPGAANSHPDGVNTFASPNTVMPKQIPAKVKSGKLTLTV